MTWNIPEYGERRVVKRFALLPIKTRIDCKVKWLEIVYLDQKFVGYWVNTYFKEEKDYVEYKAGIAIKEY